METTQTSSNNSNAQLEIEMTPIFTQNNSEEQINFAEVANLEQMPNEQQSYMEYLGNYVGIASVFMNYFFSSIINDSKK